MWEDQWITLLNYAKSYSQQLNQSLKTWSTTITITVFMNQSGKITLEEMNIGYPHSQLSINLPTIIKSS